LHPLYTIILVYALITISNSTFEGLASSTSEDVVMGQLMGISGQPDT
jgi:hypothetical protein